MLRYGIWNDKFLYSLFYFQSLHFSAVDRIKQALILDTYPWIQSSHFKAQKQSPRTTYEWDLCELISSASNFIAQRTEDA